MIPAPRSPPHHGGGGNTGSNFEQSLLVLLVTATDTEVLKGNRRNIRVAGRLANARQSAAILLLFILFSCFSSTLLFLLAQLAN